MTETNVRTFTPMSRKLVEGAAILAPIATIVGWLLTLLPVEVPASVRDAVVALVVVLGTMAFSELRNRSAASAVKSIGAAGLVVPLLFLVGCVTWNGDAYRKISVDETLALALSPADVKLDPARCESLGLGAIALRDTEGSSKSLNAPFFSGQHVAEFASIHDRQASICWALSVRDDHKQVIP